MNNLNIEDVIAAIKQVRDKARAEADNYRAGSIEWVQAMSESSGAADCIVAVHRLYMDAIANQR